ncbi:quinone oxidoreductase family protein [Phyllobacterium myrsinacearum]|uniref:NADPH2:quinone reductase n=1 Tax=Phyllobacterium myrsinacearum TaxID=28101 RepID=A0A839EHR2_9HYPH|nr:quinone oxidoreductase [Phyllobacterium myrsinacearum]MBA8878329.1 NADPH2:quinone reductase [Phyllobacterium myrsinacearum]
MFALTLEEFGGADALHWREIPDPRLEPGFALVRIKAAGLNFADIYRRKGNYHMDAIPPWVLGYEGAGEIVALAGDNLQGFRIGTRVGFADAPRANAEIVAIPLDKLIPLPDDIGFDVAASLLLQGLTAQYLVSDSYNIRGGEWALVHAAAGGVGLLLTQMLAARGAKVIALASSPEKRAAASAAGALHSICYEGDWSAHVIELSGHGVDVVYESVGSTLPESLAATRTGGAIIFYGFAGGNPAPIDPRILMDRSLTITGGDLWNVLTGPEERRRRAATLFAMVQSEKIKTTIAARIPMQNGAEAHRLLESRGIIGKVILTLD